MLRAGIAAILQDYDKGITILKEAETLRAEIASAQSSAVPTLPPIASPGPSDAPVIAEALTTTFLAQPEEKSSGEKGEALTEEEAKLDNGKRKEFSYRELMASCLVCISSHPRE